MNIRIIRSHEKTTEEQLVVLEKSLGCTLPQEYRKFLLCYNGGYPEENRFNMTQSLQNTLPRALLELRPRVYRELLFLDEPIPDDATIDRIVTKHGTIAAQCYFNHVHLLPFTEDLLQQRQWATQLVAMIRSHFQEVDRYTLLTDIRDDNCDVEVSFWTIKRQSVCSGRTTASGTS